MTIKIAFDCDGTLIDEHGPRYKVIDLLRSFYDATFYSDIIVWSGSGVDYANMVVNRLGLRVLANVRVIEKCSEDVDIVVDDSMKRNRNNLTGPYDFGNGHTAMVILRV